MNFDWTCRFCQKHCTITDSNLSGQSAWFKIKNKHGPVVVSLQFIVCPNPKCKEFSLTATMSKYTETTSGPRAGSMVEQWQLVPPSSAKAFPDYVPAPVLQDYREACLIQNLSPKASATLARRCLQGND